MITIEFQAAEKACRFRWSGWSGRAELDVDGATTLLTNPRDPATHIDPSLVHTWTQIVGTTHVEIEKRRPVVLAGFRRNDFTVRVDGEVVVETSGH